MNGSAAQQQQTQAGSQLHGRVLMERSAATDAAIREFVERILLQTPTESPDRVVERWRAHRGAELPWGEESRVRRFVEQAQPEPGVGGPSRISKLPKPRPSPGVFTISTRTRQIHWARDPILVGIGLVLLAPWLPGLSVFVGIGGIISILIGLAQLSSVYEVCLTQDDTLRFVKLSGVTEFHIADIQHIVRSERKSNGSLRSIAIVYRGGRISVAGNEDLGYWLTAVAPAVWVQVKEYDDTDAWTGG